MANPFGGTITGKNNSHGSAAALKYVFIPRSTTVVKEIITDVTATISGPGSISAYDSEGYLAPANTSKVFIEADVTALSHATSKTLIVGYKHTAQSGIADCIFNIRNTSASYVNIAVQVDAYMSRCAGIVSDGSNDWAGTWGNDYADSDVYVAIAVRNQAGTQTTRFRASTSLNSDGGITATSNDGTLSGTVTTNNNNGQLNRLNVDFLSDTRWQYLMVYEEYLSNGQVDAILADPGDVLSYEAGPLPKMGRCIYHLP